MLPCLRPPRPRPPRGLRGLRLPQHVLDRERKGDFLGKTVQVVPHVTNTIQEWIERVAHSPQDGQRGAPDVCVIELGGTVGDIESMPFIEVRRGLDRLSPQRSGREACPCVGRGECL